MKTQLMWLASLVASFAAACVHGQEPVFSGPQPGEALPALQARGVFDQKAGKATELVPENCQNPILIVFVHELTRPSVAVTRAVMNYAATRAEDGLRTAIVFLFDDLTEGTQILKRARHALPNKTAIAISPEGKEGPGSYGLNRNVTLTVLVADKGKVAANFALVQPSVQADVPKVLESLVAVIGGKVPSLDQLDIPGNPREEMKPGETDLRPLLAPVIRKNASEQEVEKAAGNVEEHVRKHPEVGVKIGDVARRIIQAGKLENYGTSELKSFCKNGPSSIPQRTSPRSPAVSEENTPR